MFLHFLQLHSVFRLNLQYLRNEVFTTDRWEIRWKLIIDVFDILPSLTFYIFSIVSLDSRRERTNTSQ